MTDAKERRLSVASRQGSGARYYVEGRGLTVEGLAWLYEKWTGQKASEQDVERCRTMLASAAENTPAPKESEKEPEA